MNATLSRRKHRLAARLTTDTAKTWGLWTVVAFVALAIISLIYTSATGEYQPFAEYVLLMIPVPMTVLGWIHLPRSYHRALTNGLTRQEFLIAFGLFGAVTVLTAAVFTQLGYLALDALNTDASNSGFYGIGLFESVARPALYFAFGSAAGAALHLIPNRRIGVAIGILVFAAIAYRQYWYFSALSSVIGPTKFEIADLAWLDASLACLFAVAAWALLARAPMQPKAA